MANKQYWNNLYGAHRQKQSHKPFDWMLTFEQVYPYLLSVVPERLYSFLDLGCGTSDFSLKLWKTSKTPVIIYQMDFSEEALRYSQRLFSEADLSDEKQINVIDTVNTNQPRKQTLR